MKVFLCLQSEALHSDELVLFSSADSDNCKHFASVELACLKCLVILECVLIFVAEAPSLLEPSVAEHAIPSWGRTGVFRHRGSQALTETSPKLL